MAIKARSIDVVKNPKEVFDEEVKKLENFLSLFEVIDLDKNISISSTNLIKTYAKSHNLDIPDSLIASTALVYGYSLFTYNLKDFRYIENINLV